MIRRSARAPPTCPKNSLANNDENLLLIRCETPVTDIYVTELDRILRHVCAREALDPTAKEGANSVALDSTDDWIKWNFRPGSTATTVACYSSLLTRPWLSGSSPPTSPILSHRLGIRSATMNKEKGI
jgi:hypothetical protein